MLSRIKCDSIKFRSAIDAASGVGRRWASAGLKAGATVEESFWVNIIGRGYPPPPVILSAAKDLALSAQGKLREESLFDPVNVFVKQRLGHSL